MSQPLRSRRDNDALCRRQAKTHQQILEIVHDWIIESGGERMSVTDIDGLPPAEVVKHFHAAMSYFTGLSAKVEDGRVFWVSEH